MPVGGCSQLQTAASRKIDEPTLLTGGNHTRHLDIPLPMSGLEDAAIVASLVAGLVSLYLILKHS